MNNKEQKITEINGGVTAEQIQAWKNQYGRVVEISVFDEDLNERHIGYFRRPDMPTIHATNAVAKGNETKASEVLFDNCWLGGSPLLKTDAIYKMNVIGSLGALYSRCTGNIKNL